MCMIRVGIDPGVKTGFAIAESGKLTHLETVDFWGAYDRIREWDPGCVEMITIEISETTHMWGKQLYGNDQDKRRVKMGQNVGAVRREGQLLAQRLRQRGYSVRCVPPRGKVSADYFRRLTGWTGTSNEHTRDAGLLAI